MARAIIIIIINFKDDKRPISLQLYILHKYYYKSYH